MERKQDGGEIFRPEEWEALAAELIKIPKERRTEIQRETVIVIAEMERAHSLESAAAADREERNTRREAIFRERGETRPETGYRGTEED